MRSRIHFPKHFPLYLSEAALRCVAPAALAASTLALAACGASGDASETDDPGSQEAASGNASAGKPGHGGATSSGHGAGGGKGDTTGAAGHAGVGEGGTSAGGKAGAGGSSASEGGVCAGSAAPQASEDVSAAFGAAPGVRVTRITDKGENALSYYDVPFFSAATNKFYFNTQVGGWNWALTSTATNGTGAESLTSRVVPTSPSAFAGLSSDGKLITYAREKDQHGTGWDLYGVFVDRGGACEEFQITHENWRDDTQPEISPATYDATTGKYLIALGVGTTLYLVYDDGTGPKGHAGPWALPLTDHTANLAFHRVRLNPRFADVVFYRRDTAKVGATELYVFDWSSATPSSTLFFSTPSGGPHETWTPDGLKIATNDDWTEHTVVTPQGHLVSGLDVTNVVSKSIGPFGKGDPAYHNVFYGSYSPDGSRLAVVDMIESQGGGKIYLMDEAGKVRFLTNTRAQGPNVDGQPRLGFFNGTKGIAFSSDNSVGQQKPAATEVYTITGYDPTP